MLTNLTYINLYEYEFNTLPLNSLPQSLIQEYKLIPFYRGTDELHIAISNPENINTIDSIQFQTELKIKFFIADEERITQLINHLVSKKEYAQVITQQINQDTISIQNFVDQIIQDAIYRNASDIHFEPLEKNYRIRMRIDGMLYEMTSQSIDIAKAVTTRLKILANLDIAEKRLPQDGGFLFKTKNAINRNCRLSTCPTLFGEKVVLRLLNSNQQHLDIHTLGLKEDEKTLLLNAIKKPQGLILVTGPTGSGKTMTLYGLLNLLNISTCNIVTIEDPIEIQLPGINQVNIHTAIGMTFSKALRAFLRQDPDIMMVGEIRDKETAEMAIHAAQTGHLVLSTLHTNNAFDTISRLINMGIAPFNIASSLLLIVAQRLVRVLCDQCKKSSQLSDEFLEKIGLEKSLTKNLFQASNCEYCTQGYKGRTGIFEIFPLHPDSQEIIFHHQSSDIHHDFKKSPFNSLWQSALHKVSLGITSLEEAYRVAGGE